MIIKLQEDLKTIKKKSAHEINQIIRGKNYMYCDFLMTWNYKSLEEIKSILKYYCINVEFVCQYLQNLDLTF